LLVGAEETLVMTHRARRLLVGAVAIFAAIGGEGRAQADERQECAASAEQAQQLRDEGKYRRAREQMLVCGREVCPGPIKSDCGKWLTELDRDAPTVVLGARDGKGGDLVDVRVSMDNTVISERLDGKPVLVDSGEHTFKFESKDGGVKEERVLLRAAEKARPIIVTIGASGPSTSPAASSSAAHESGSEGSIVPAAIVGGLGVVALGSFAYFGLSGKSDVDDLQGCKPKCAEKDVDAARTKLIIADISLGVGVVALAVATFMFVTRPKVEAKVQTASIRRLRIDAAPVRGGGAFGLAGQF
jgi:hypothetical protein